MEALSFFTQYPIRLVQDFSVHRRNNDFILKCLRLEGDGPGFPQERVSFPKALPRGDLMLDLGDENWVQLYPFVMSFERGHTEERRDISDALALLADGQKSES